MIKYVEVIEDTDATLLDSVDSEYVALSFGTMIINEFVVGGNLTR